MSIPWIVPWSLVALGVVAAAWGIAHRRRRRDVVAATIGVAASVVGLVLVAFAGMGAFCVPPPGAACM